MADFGKDSEFRNETEMSQVIFPTTVNDSVNGTITWVPFKWSDLLPQTYLNARIFMYKYLVVIIWTLSFLGNSLVIVVLTKKKNRNFSTSVYLTGLAIADLSLNTANTFMLYFRAHGHIKDPESVYVCRYRNVFSFAVAFIATWMLVAISIERVISVWLPHKVKRLCTVKVAYAVITSIWILFIGLAFLHESMMEFYNLGCQIRLEYAKWYNKYLSWVLITLKFLLPYVIIFTSTIIIVRTILYTRRIRRHSTQKDKRTSVNVVMLNVNVVFLLTNSPYIFFYCFAEYTSLAPTNMQSYAYYYFWYSYLQVLSDFNSAVNVFVYFLVGSRFRADVKEFLYSCVPKQLAKLVTDGPKARSTHITGSSPPPQADRRLPKIEKALRRQESQFTM